MPQMFHSQLTKLLFITRARFLMVTVMPVLLATIIAVKHYAAVVQLDFILALLLGTACCHLAANVFNDYFDWQSGTDQNNCNYVANFSGGSRTLPNGLLTEAELLRLGFIFLIISACCAIFLTISCGPFIILLSCIGGFIGYFYTAPPVRLIARGGLGELAVFLCFGPCLTAGVLYVLTGTLTSAYFIFGIPVGLLTTSILAINEYPDIAADAKAQKKTIAVLLGEAKQPYFVIALIIAAYAVTAMAIVLQIFPKIFWLIFVTVPFAYYECSLVLRVNKARAYLELACATNVKLYTLFSLTQVIAAWIIKP